MKAIIEGNKNKGNKIINGIFSFIGDMTMSAMYGVTKLINGLTILTVVAVLVMMIIGEFDWNLMLEQILITIAVLLSMKLLSFFENKNK